MSDVEAALRSKGIDPSEVDRWQVKRMERGNRLRVRFGRYGGIAEAAISPDLAERLASAELPGATRVAA